MMITYTMTYNNGLEILVKSLSSFSVISTLLTIYKTFVRPHLDCGDIIYKELQFILSPE